MSVRRRELLRAGLFAAFASSCGDAKGRKRRTLDDAGSEHPKWTPTELAPESVDPSVPNAVLLILSRRLSEVNRVGLARGFGLAGGDFGVEQPAGTARALEDTMISAARAGVRLLVVEPRGDEETAARVARERHIPVLFLSVTEGNLGGLGEWSFLTCVSDEKLGVAAAEIVERKKPKRIAILSADSVAGRASSAGFRRALEARKLPKPILEARIGETEPLAKHVKSVRELHADTVFVPLSDTMFRPLADEMARQSVSPKLLVGVDTIADPGLAPRLEGASFVTHYHHDAPGSLNAIFSDTRRAKYSGPPSIFEAIGYDAGLVVKSALARAKDGSREAVKEAIASTSKLAITTGETSYDQRGCPDRTVMLCRFAGDGITLDGTVLARA